MTSNIQRVHLISKALTIMGIGDETGPGPRRARGGVSLGKDCAFTDIT